jgi:hypothetical protein
MLRNFSTQYGHRAGSATRARQEQEDLCPLPRSTLLVLATTATRAGGG